MTDKDKFAYLYTFLPYYLAYAIGFINRAVLFGLSALVAGYRQGKGGELGWEDVVFLVGILIVGVVLWMA